MHKPWARPYLPQKLSVVLHTCSPALKRDKPEHQKLQVILWDTASEKPAWVHDTLETIQGGSRPEKQCWEGEDKLLVPPSLALGSHCELQG